MRTFCIFLLFPVCFLSCSPLAVFGKDVGNQTAQPGATMDYSVAADVKLKQGAIINLPLSPGAGSVYVATDAVNVEDCSIGGGLASALCVYSGIAWSAVVNIGDIAKINNLIMLTGVNGNSTDLGVFTGTTIPDNSTVKSALQSLETAQAVPTSFTIHTSDNCAGETMADGDLCFEY